MGKKEIYAGIREDILSFIGIPTATACAIYDSILQERQQNALEYLLCEIRKGNFDNVDKNEFISIMARYQRDAMEGVAKNNLRLMARLIYKLNEKKQLTAPNFQKYAKILADLSEDELVILSAIIKDFDEKEENLIGNSIDKALVELCGIPEVRNEAKYSKCIETLSSLERTGLVISQKGGFFNTAHKNAVYSSPYHITSFMKELINLFPNWEDIAKWDEEDN